MEQLSAVVDRLTRRGYRDDFTADGEMLRSVRTGRRYPPAEFFVDDVARFEGITDPDDEVIVFALRCPADGTRGTYVVAYGPKTPADDAVVVVDLDARTRL